MAFLPPRRSGSRASSPTGSPPTRQSAYSIGGVHTELVVTLYSNRTVAVATQLKKMGTLLLCELNTTPGQVALAWIMTRPGMTSAIASGTTVEQVKDLTASAELVLPADAVTALTEVSA